MSTAVSRFRGGLVCSLFAVLACSVDARSLSLSNTNGAAGGGSDIAASGGSIEASPDADANAGESFAPPSCVGESPARRCAVTGGLFQLDPAGVAVPGEVSNFQLDELEVTVGRFREYVTSFSGPPSTDAGADPEVEHSGWQSEWTALFPSNQERLIESLHCNADWQTWTDAPEDREDYPLTCASYYVAFAFCAWSGGRLPTEAEWEYAASGGAEQRVYPWGNDQPSFERASFDAASISPAGGHRSGIARFGQLDLAGSAWEWALDSLPPLPRHL